MHTDSEKNAKIAMKFVQFDNINNCDCGGASDDTSMNVLKLISKYFVRSAIDESHESRFWPLFRFNNQPILLKFRLKECSWFTGFNAIRRNWVSERFSRTIVLSIKTLAIDCCFFFFCEDSFG